MTTDHGRLTVSRSSAFSVQRTSFLLGLFVSAAMAALSLHPQIELWLERGSAWRGEYAQMYSDEPFYAVYVNALRSGRPRKNDPYSGRDDAPGRPLPESILSVQFLAGYAVALPARLFGFSAATAFILLPPLVAFLSSLALFRLVLRLTGDAWVAAAAVPFVLCLGVLVTYQGAIRTLAGTPPIYTYLPFLRRFLPAVAFPAFLCFFVFVLRALDSLTARARRLRALAAAAAFAALVYSYFYLWTAALAWLACLAVAVLLAPRKSPARHAELTRRGEPTRRDGPAQRDGHARDDERRPALEVFGLLAACATVALAPYFVMLARRAPDTDAVQALALTRAPDLFRRPELVGFLLLAALAFAAWRGLIDRRERAAQFALAFALMPFAVYNQQLLTGRTIQPLHYDTYGANYSVLIALVLVAWLLARKRLEVARAAPADLAADAASAPREMNLASPSQETSAASASQETNAASGERNAVSASSATSVVSTSNDRATVSASRKARVLLLLLAAACFGWGFVESKVEADRLAAFNRGRDVARAAALRVAELTSADARVGASAAHDGALAARVGAADYPVVLWTDLTHANELPGVAPEAAVLWAMHQYSYPGVALAENKERLFTHLYYTGVNPARFADLAAHDLRFRHFLFGWERINRRLNPNWRPVSTEETRAEIDAYAAFVSAFTRERAARLPLSYLVAPAERPPDLSNLERFYTRDAGERAGPFVIHRLRLRENGQEPPTVNRNR